MNVDYIRELMEKRKDRYLAVADGGRCDRSEERGRDHTGNFGSICIKNCKKRSGYLTKCPDCFIYNAYPMGVYERGM